MTFTEIFNNFKNHKYIQRKCWHKDVFIQYRDSVDLIRLVQFVEGSQAYADEPFVIDNDTRLTASDLFADDWVVKEEQKQDYVKTLKQYTDEWRITDKYIDEIKDAINKKRK